MGSQDGQLVIEGKISPYFFDLHNLIFLSGCGLYMACTKVDITLMSLSWPIKGIAQQKCHLFKLQSCFKPERNGFFCGIKLKLLWRMLVTKQFGFSMHGQTFFHFSKYQAEEIKHTDFSE